MRKFKENILKILLYLSAIFTVGILVFILGFIFIKGYKEITPTFILSEYSASGDGGIMPMIVSTLYVVGISILVATPIGVLAAVYLQEYAKQGKVVKIIRFCTESLSGIPSIVYGLFGAIFFVGFLKFGYSLLSGALTVSIIILPVIIRTTEEALKVVSTSYREASARAWSYKISNTLQSNSSKCYSWDIIRDNTFHRACSWRISSYITYSRKCCENA